MGFLSTYWTDFIERLDGPLHFRLFVQPLMAILFAVRDGSRDAREGRSAYLWTLLTDPTQRRYLLESGWKGISKVFVPAFALDTVDGHCSGGDSVRTVARPHQATSAYEPGSARTTLGAIARLADASHSGALTAQPMLRLPPRRAG